MISLQFHFLLTDNVMQYYPALYNSSNPNETELETGSDVIVHAGDCGGIHVYHVISFAFAVCGAAGNVLTFIVTVRYKPRSVYTGLLSALSVADGLVCAIVMTTLGLVFISKCTGGQYLPGSVHTLHDIVQLTSIWILVTMTIDRFLAIKKVFSKVLDRTKCLLIIVTIVLCSILLVVPCKLNSNLVCNSIDIAIRYPIPICIMFVLNIKLLKNVKNAKRQHEVLTGSMKMVICESFSTTRTESVSDNSAPCRRQSATNSKTWIIILVVIVFLICGTSRGTVMILMHIHSVAFDKLFWGGVTYVLMVFNSSINFVIYILFYDRFRKGLKTLCRCQDSSHSVWNTS